MKALEQKKFVSDIAFTFGTRVFLAGFQFFFRIGIAFLIGPYNQGIFYWYLQTILIASTFIAMGMGTSSVYFLAKQQHLRSQIISSTLFFTIVSGAFWLAVAWGTIRLFDVSSFLHVDFSVIVITLLIIELLISCQNILLGLGQARQYNTVLIVQSVLQLALLFIFLTQFRKIDAAVYAYLWSAIAAAIMSGYILLRSEKICFPVFDHQFVKRILFGLSLWFPAIITLLNLRLNFYMVQHFLGTGNSGIFSVAVMIAEVLWFVPDSITPILLPEASRREGGEKSISFGNTVCRYTLIITTALLIMVLLCGIVLFCSFSKYRLSLYPFLLLLPGVFSFVLCKVLSALIISKGKVAITNYSSFTIFVINLTVCWLLIPELGLSGAALGTSISYIAGTIIALVYYARLTNSSYEDILIPKKTDLTGIINTFLKKS